jgi:glycosyltransferase involved in cell wall biosynthesis
MGVVKQMNLLFIHDHRFYREGDLVYSSGTLSKELWINNYLPYFDKISVIGRCSNDKKHKLVLASVDGGRVDFNLITEYTSIKSYFLNYLTIKNRIKEEILKADLTVVRLPCIFGFIAVPVLVKYHKPFFTEVVGNIFELFWNYGSIAAKLSAHYFNKTTKKCVKKSPFVVYVTRKLQKDYPSDGYTMTISDVILSSIISPDSIKMTRFYNKTIKIGLIGSIANHKGHAILLTAISKLNDQIKENIELYFIGNGNTNWLTKLVSKFKLNKNVKFIGTMPHNEIFDFLKSLSLYIQPSYQEGMPRAMLEAMSMGCPVLASAVGGIPDVVRQQFLHKPGDYQRLSEQIKYFYKNRYLLEKEALSNLEIIKEFAKDNLDKKRKEFYTKITNEYKENSYAVKEKR